MRNWKISDEARAKAFEQGEKLLLESGKTFLGEQVHPVTGTDTREVEITFTAHPYHSEEIDRAAEHLLSAYNSINGGNINE